MSNSGSQISERTSMAEKLPNVGQFIWYGFQGLLGLAIVIGSWYLRETASTLKGLDDRMTNIELWKAETAGNRFTAKDGAEVWKEISSIKSALAIVSTNQVRVLTELPKIDELIKSNARIESKIEGLDKTINRHIDKPGTGISNTITGGRVSTNILLPDGYNKRDVLN